VPSRHHGHVNDFLNDWSDPRFLDGVNHAATLSYSTGAL
jgi:hypothetical protein